jgi:hypothetical protein
LVQNHLDEVSDCIARLEQQNFAQPLVHVMAREADSIGHLRRWEADGTHWLVRAKGKTPPLSCRARRWPVRPSQTSSNIVRRTQ